MRHRDESPASYSSPYLGSDSAGVMQPSHDPPGLRGLPPHPDRPRHDQHGRGLLFQLKRSIDGTHHRMSTVHLYRYLAQVSIEWLTDVKDCTSGQGIWRRT